MTDPVPHVASRRAGLAELIEFVALWGIVFLQPTLDVLSKNAAIFVTRDTTPGAAVLFVVILAVGPPLVLWLAELLVGLAHAGARRIFHVAVLGALAGVFMVELLIRTFELARGSAAVLGVPAAVGAAVLLGRIAASRLWLRYLALTTPFFMVMFLFFSPVHDAVFAEGPDASSASTSIDTRSRVVMMVLDELPLVSLLDGTGQVDDELFPNFAALAGESTWYRNHTSVAGYTQVAMPAILTGDLPTETNPIANAGTFPHSLFTLLGGTYEMNVHESATRLCPGNLCQAIGGSDDSSRAGMWGLLDEARNAWTRFAWPDRSTGSIDLAGSRSLAEPDALETGDAFLRSLRPATSPRLDFLHVLLPHQPWHYLPTGQDYQQGTAHGAPFYTWVNDHVARSASQRHLLQLQAADRLLGRIMARLKALGAYDRSLLVVTADHGVSFTSLSSIRGLSPETYHSVAWTPLFVKAPRQDKAVVDDEPVESIDILPTIADHLDARLPWGVDGRSALGPRREEGPRPFYRWDLNQMEPRKGSDFVQLDGRAGFARVLRSRAAAPDTNAELRLYRSGPYGHLVGTTAAPRVRDGRGPEASIDHPDRYRSVDLDAHEAPWAYLSGTFQGPPETPLAIAANGRIVAFSEAFAAGNGPATFWAMLPPSLLRNGDNRLQLYEVHGDPRNPWLQPLQPP